MSVLNASQSSAKNVSSGSSSSWSNTAGNAATIKAQQAAAAANSAAQANWREAAEYNAKQAQIQREWQEKMANTVYQRSVKDMKAAGINPILAASMGLGTASVGSGATASISSADTFASNTYPEQNSASTASNSAEGWSNSTSGLSTFLEQMSGLIGGLIGATNSAQAIDISLNGLDSLLGTKSNSTSLFEKHTENSKNNAMSKGLIKDTRNIFEKLGDTIKKGISYQKQGYLASKK